MNTDDNNVVKLRQPVGNNSAGVSVVDDNPINPKSLLNMTELEQDMFLQQLRDRRMRMAAVLQAAHVARTHTNNLMSAVKLEKKADQVQKQLDKVTKALDKLEEQLYGLRALTLQHTDMDIVNVKTDDAANTK